MKKTRSPSGPRKVQVLVQTHFQKRSVTARVALIGDGHFAGGASVELALYQYVTDKIVGRRTIRSLLPGLRSEVTFDLKQTGHGVCWFQATVTDRNGQSFPAEVIQEQAPAKTAWLGTKKGISRRVPAPWTPLKTAKSGKSITVKPWGREYHFDANTVASKITAANKPLLAKPAQFIARVNGRNLRWKADGLRTVSKADDQTVITGKCTGNDLKVTFRNEIDFDGMVRVDWALTTQKTVRLDRLILEITLPQDHAKYIYHYPGAWGAATNARALNPKGESMGFLPFVWLGDEQRGLGCFFESTENWYNRSTEGLTEIKRSGSNVVLRLHVVSKPVELIPASGKSGITHTGMGTVEGTPVVEGLQYTFGLHATPVKPVVRDAWDERMMCLGVEELSPAAQKVPLSFSNKILDEMAAGGVRTVVIFEYWTDMEGHAVATNGPKLKKLIKAIHDRGMKAILYFSFLISDMAPEWRDFGDQCVKMPRTGYPVFHYPPQPEQSAWVHCLKSVWQDFLADGIASAMKDFDADGVYLDGTELPFGCMNSLHGCGTTKPDGSLEPTYPILGVREAMRRIYQVVKAHKPNGIVNVHNSTCMVIPTLGWATSYWDGEQFGQMRAHEDQAARKDLGAFLPLDSFRTEFMGHQWGVPAEFLCYDKPFTYEQAWGFCLLHDVPVRPCKLNEQIKLASSIWQVMDRFGRKKSEFLPYWNNEKLVSIGPAKAYVSLYQHPRNGVLVVITNFGNKTSKVAVELSIRKLKLTGQVQASDALTGQKIEIDRGRLDLPLKPMAWKLVWIK